MSDIKKVPAFEKKISALNLNSNPLSASEVPHKEIKTDILIIGGGYAGTFAAMEAREKGLDVTVIDKGRVGKGGKTPWAAAFTVFDPSSGESRDELLQQSMEASEYTVRRDFVDMWLDDSMDRYKDLESWGAIERKGEKNQADVFRQQLRKNGVRLIERAVITSLIEKDGQVKGAVGFVIDRTKAIVVNAKAVVICSGSGSFKNPGYPIGSLTHDGQAMAYKLGAEIAGKENIDTHETKVREKCDPWTAYGTEYLWPILPKFDSRPPGDPAELGGAGRPPSGKAPESPPAGPPEGRPPMMNGPDLIYAAQKGRVPVTPQVVIGGKGCMGPKILDENEKLVLSATAGMAMHRCDGIFTKMGTCWTGIDGLYAAGDAVYASIHGIGLTSAGCSVMGARAGVEASGYVKGKSEPELQAGQIAGEIEEMFEPLFRETGYSPSWVTQYLQSMMTPYFVLYVKNREMLEAALTNVEYLQKNVVTRLKANDMHELRLVYETKNMVLNAEMKLRASLFRKESRGNHYREDFPARDDKNWLSWVVITKDGEQMKLTNRPIPDEWKPELSLTYKERYSKRFPGEDEYLKENGAL